MSSLAVLQYNGVAEKEAWLIILDKLLVGSENQEKSVEQMKRIVWS